MQQPRRAALLWCVCGDLWCSGVSAVLFKVNKKSLKWKTFLLCFSEDDLFSLHASNSLRIALGSAIWNCCVALTFFFTICLVLCYGKKYKEIALLQVTAPGSFPVFLNHSLYSYCTNWNLKKIFKFVNSLENLLRTHTPLQCACCFKSRLSINSSFNQNNNTASGLIKSLWNRLYLRK